MGVILCDETDVKNRLGGRDLTTEETAGWKGLAEEASVLIEGFLNRTWTDDDADDTTVPDAVPRNVRVVCSRMVARCFPNGPLSGPGTAALPPGTRSFNSSMGPLGHTTTFGSEVEFGQPYLSRNDRISLRRTAAPVEHHPMFHDTGVDRLGRDFARKYGY